MVKKVDRTPVGAHYGWQDWLAQRVTAFIMVLFSLVLIAFVVAKGSVAYADWRDLFAAPLMRVLTLLFFLSMFYHAWIGARDILMDYIKPVLLRLALEVGVIVFLVGCAIWTVSILWSAPAIGSI